MGFNNSARKLGEPGSDQRELILDKIHRLIDRADPDYWRHGGGTLEATMHFEKPRKTWEEVYTQEIDKGTLLFRKSTPVTSEFSGKGFKLLPIADPQFTVELRARGWHHSELTDPDRRSQLSDRTCHVLAEGSIAEQLLLHVEESYASYHNTLQKQFDEEAQALVSTLVNRLQEETVDSWERSEDNPGEVHYRSVVDDCTVDAYRMFVGSSETYGLVVSRKQKSSQIRDVELVKDVFLAVEELGQTSRLLTLSKALEHL